MMVYRPHWFQSRRIIPNQKVHNSVLSGDEYVAQATLGNGFDIPIGSRRALRPRPVDRFWTTEHPDEDATTKLLISLLHDQHKMLDCLERVLFLLESSEFPLTVTPLTTLVLKRTRTASW